MTAPAKPAGHTAPAAPAPLPRPPLVPVSITPFAPVLAQVLVRPAPAPLAAALPAPLPVAPRPAELAPVLSRKHHDAEPGLDALARQTAHLAPPPQCGSTPIVRAEPEQAPEARGRLSLEDLVPQLVKKIAWSGDARGGTVRMELGAGELAGSTLVVSAENGRVSVELRSPAGTDVARWRDRLAARLDARGIAVDSFEVT